MAPFYGADRDGRRGGWNPLFLERIRRGEYPQYLWDKLPVGTQVKESVLRLDHLQPLGGHAGAGRELLEWQPRPGVNTIGMLMSHLAVVEAYWVGAVLSRKEEREDRIVLDIAGIAIDDDGMPLASDGSHPASLTGYSLEDYLALLERTRSHTHRCLQVWDDARLDELVTSDGHQVSRGWVAYHLLEHFAQHAGQIALLQSLFRS